MLYKLGNFMTKYFKYPFAQQGDNIVVPDELQTNGGVSYKQGFGYDYQRKLGSDPLAKPVPRQQTNQLYNDITGAIKQYQENGFYNFITPEMNGGEAFSYDLAACIRYDMSDAKDGSDVRNFSSKKNDNKGNPKDNPGDWWEIGGNTYTLYSFFNVTQSTVLSVDQSGIILIDASSGDLTVTLPITDLNISYTFERIDNTPNKVIIKASSGETIKFHLNNNITGYEFFYLMGAGDYWKVVYDGKGSWYKLGRLDDNPLGRVFFDANLQPSSGGYLLANGTLLNRLEYPWLWDFAQKSGVLVSESDRVGNEGCFTRGDGATTFRIPDLRGEFLRVLDSDRGIDSARVAGSWQKGTFYSFDTLPVLSTVGNAVKATLGGDLKKMIGVDTGVVDDFGSNVGLCWSNSSGSNWLPTLTDSEWGTTRSRNIAFPVYIKII